MVEDRSLAEFVKCNAEPAARYFFKTGYACSKIIDLLLGRASGFGASHASAERQGQRE